MTVTLSKRTEEIVEEQLKTGHFATPDEVVNRIIEAQFPCESGIPSPSGPTRSELEASLVAALDKPTRPYRKGEFIELAQRIAEESRGA
jgi:hypothetical protein